MYKVSLSNKASVYISKEEYEKLLQNMSSNFVLLGEKLINPSFIISIIEETEVEKIPKTKVELDKLEIVKKQQSECTLCDKKGWFTKKDKDGVYDVVVICKCQFTADLLDK